MKKSMIIKIIAWLIIMVICWFSAITAKFIATVLILFLCLIDYLLAPKIAAIKKNVKAEIDKLNNPENYKDYDYDDEDWG